MMKTLAPVIYDFKRSFLRISTILFLILFIFAGIGTSYLVINTIREQFPSTNILAVIVNVNGTCIMEGYVFDITGNPIDAELEITSVDGEILYHKNVYGNFHIEDKNLCNLFREANLKGRIKSSLGESSLHIYTHINYLHDIKKYGERSFIFIYTGIVEKIFLLPKQAFPGKPIQLTDTFQVVGITKFIIISRSSGNAKLIISLINYTNPNMFYPNTTIMYGLTSSASLNENTVISTVDTDDISYNLLGRLVDKYVDVYDLEISNEYDAIVLKFIVNNMTHYHIINYGFLPDTETIYAQGLMSHNVGLSLFTQFFPIIFLYLAYVLIAKPRSTGALEFIIARPITRWDLYVTRFLAGFLTAVVSSALFILGNNIANYILLGLSLDIYVNTVLFLGLVASLTSFYALCYMIASSIRSGMYLAISIIIYLLFSMFWGLIILIYSFTVGGGFASYGENLYRLSYLNPLSPAQIYAPYIVLRYYNLTPPLTTVRDELVDPILVIITPIIWTITCFIIGYRIFRKINLTT